MGFPTDHRTARIKEMANEPPNVPGMRVTVNHSMYDNYIYASQCIQWLNKTISEKPLAEPYIPVWDSRNGY